MKKKYTRYEFLKAIVFGFITLGVYKKAYGFLPFGFWKKKAATNFTGTISANQQELNLRTWALANSWNGSSAATITISSGVYIWSDNTANPALTINGSWPGGISLINNGYIMGKGGAGGGSNRGTQNGENGGPAISLGCAVTIDTTNGYIGGGGGGGGGCLDTGSSTFTGAGGGGAGGGIGGSCTGGGGSGSGGAVGQSGSSGTPATGNSYIATYCGAGGGGRVFPSAASSQALAAGDWGVAAGPGGSGGGGGSAGGGINPGETGFGGQGGSAGQAGTNQPAGYAVHLSCGGGGGWGAAGAACAQSNFGTSGTGGTGGRAIQTNSNAVTWVGNTSKVYGVVG